MISQKFKTKKQLAHELGMSLRTLQRRLSKNELHVPRGLISPQMQIKILNILEVEIMT